MIDTNDALYAESPTETSAMNEQSGAKSYRTAFPHYYLVRRAYMGLRCQEMLSLTESDSTDMP